MQVTTSCKPKKWIKKQDEWRLEGDILTLLQAFLA